MNAKQSLTYGIVVLALVVAGSAIAQEERRPGPPTPCPHPVSLTLQANTSQPPTPDSQDFGPPDVTGSVWNQTAINKHFGHTFHFPAPPKECCLMTSGTLEVQIKCLQGGPANSSTSGNDDIALIHNRASVPGFSRRAWPTGCKTGAVSNVTFSGIPAAVLASGRVSLYVEDDTAVLSAKLALHGCCLQ